MARGKSISVSTTSTPFVAGPTSPKLPCPPQKLLKKSSSLADVRGFKKPGGWLRRLKSKSSLEFGCAGEGVEEEYDDEFEEALEEQPRAAETECEMERRMRQLHFTPPPVYQASSIVLSSRPTSADRAEIRRLEEAKALEAIASYMADQHQHIQDQPPRTRHSSSKLPLEDDTLTLPYLRPSIATRSRSSTLTSSEAGSSNRDSLPSYHTGSEPASPLYARRPSLVPLETPPLPPTPESRPYAFI